MANFITTLDNWLWASPLIFLVFGGAILYTILIKGGNITKIKLQWKLLTHGTGSETGVSPYKTFCSVVAYRVAVGNIGGVMVAIMYGGPGAIFWMIITALVTSAISYAENSLGQMYKVKMDGQYRGGPYFYMENGFPWKKVGKVFAVIFALMAAIGVPLLVTGPSANNIAMAFENSFGVPTWVSGLVVAILLFLVISGGVRRIADISSYVVPVMTIVYFAVTIIVLIGNAGAVPSAIMTIIKSAFNVDAVFGGMMGGAFNYGVKRAVNSSGSGFGETPASAAAAECEHPASQGLVNAFSVYIDVLVCFCSGIMVVVTDCFNVLSSDGVTFMHIGEGSETMAEQAASLTAGVVWVQEAASTVIPFGGAIIAICLTLFAYSTCLAYYYEGESGLAYLMRNAKDSTRKKAIWFIRILLPIMYFVWSNVTASTAWAVSECMFGLMAWINIISLLILIPQTKKCYDDYIRQIKAGVKEPYFNPQKLGIKGCDTWMEINADRIAEDEKKEKVAASTAKA